MFDYFLMSFKRIWVFWFMRQSVYGEVTEENVREQSEFPNLSTPTPTLYTFRLKHRPCSFCSHPVI